MTRRDAHAALKGTMENLPNDWGAIALLVFVLGFKHGLDADHLAAIDGLTRFNFRAGQRIARWCGMMFSLGHGAVVVLIAISVGMLAGQWRAPAWIEDLGAWISIAFLFLLGFANLRAVLIAGPHELVHPVGLKGRFLGRLQRTGNPLLIALVGALFALSFDTLSQAALFAVVGTRLGGWGYAGLLGVLFMLGMMATDGVNGLWISRLIRRADRAARIASRVMGLAISGLSLLVGTFGLIKYFSPRVDAWSDGKELAFGAAIIVGVGMSFLLAAWRARPAAVRT